MSLLMKQSSVLRHRALHMATAAFSSNNVKVTQTKLIIDGKFVDSADGSTFESIDPRTGKAICSIANAGAQDVELAVAAARRAFDYGPWARMSGRERGTLMMKFADLLEQNKDELAQLETLDNGKPLAMSAGADIPLSIEHYRYMAGYADKIFGRTIQVSNGSFHAYTLHEPVGVVAQVVPWNFPLLMMAWKTAPALAAGNTIVLKCSEQTPLTALRAGQLALEAGIPPGVINVIPGYGHVAGEALSRHMDVDKIAFTGSNATGHKIMSGSAESNLKRVTLELGGKSAAIICADADLDKAVDDMHFALFFNQGQVCCAASRIYVHESVYDEFVAKSVLKAKSRTVGDPFTTVDQGPQVNKVQFERIMKYIDIGRMEGANMMTGGKQIGTEGYFIEPTVFSDVTDTMAISTEEIFGPVMSILKFKDLEEVTKRANASKYGLAAGVFSQNINTCNTLSRNLRAGTVWINCFNNFDAALPFGGFKGSGFGRDKGYAALEAYTEIKTVQTPLYDAHWR